MKVEIGRASIYGKHKIKEINSLNDLIKIMKRERHDLIISLYSRNDDCEINITIYDDYVEM